MWCETGANIPWTNKINKMAVSHVNYSSKQCATSVGGGKLLVQERFWARGQRDQHSINTLKTLISGDQRLRSCVPHRKDRSGFILYFVGAGGKLSSCRCRKRSLETELEPEQKQLGKVPAAVLMKLTLTVFI